MHERNAEQKNSYFRELTRNLEVEWFDVLPEQDGLLPVELDGQPLCRILDSGGVRYWEKDIADEGRREALERVTDIAKITDEYMSQMDKAPKLKVGSLEGDYRLLAEFNGTVLAGHLTKYGVQFITWDRSADGTSLNQGNYYAPEYAAGSYLAAKQNFAVRSGLVDKNQLFTPEQLAEVYRCIHETLGSAYPLTDSRRKILETACTQIENAVSNLNDLVGQSNQEELELGASWLAQGLSMSG
ncbi:MAG: hypothetical protein K2N78_12710 [Oscillospiraceae bacterium]|nr:hypothetical protein [Oscillospiraceae bacterium]